MAYVPLSFDGKAAVRIDSTPEVAEGDMVSGNFFSGLGVRMARGRGFTDEDEQHHAPIAVLSYNYWTRRFSRSPDVLGQTLFVKGVPLTVVGIAAAGFEGTEPGTFRRLLDTAPVSRRAERLGQSLRHDGKTYLIQSELVVSASSSRVSRPALPQQQALAQTQAVVAQALPSSASASLACGRKAARRQLRSPPRPSPAMRSSTARRSK